MYCRLTLLILLSLALTPSLLAQKNNAPPPLSNSKKKAITVRLLAVDLLEDVKRSDCFLRQ